MKPVYDNVAQDFDSFKAYDQMENIRDHFK